MPDFYLTAPGPSRPAGRRALPQTCLPLLGALLLSLPGWAQTPVLTSRSPARHAVSAPAAGNLSLTFSQPLAPATVPGLRAWGSQRRGLRPGVASLPSPALLSFDPSQDFAPGEEVSVSVPATITSAGGVAVAPSVYQFRVAAGSSSGTFGSSTATTLGASPQRAQLADLDNDGDLDLLSSLNSGLAFRRNSGTGTFPTAATSISLPGALTDFVVADFDNDGDLDLLGCNGGSQLRFQRNNGAGVFTNANANFISVGNNAEHLALADVDADGDLDLLVTYPSDNAVGLHFNDGSGSFGPTVSLPTDGTPTALAVGDTDNDGDLDLLVSNADLDLVSTYPNDGNGSFGSARDTFVGSYPVALALADLSGDGRPDLLTLNANDQTLSLRLGSATGFRGNSTVPVPATTVGFTLGDVDGDGDLDLVLAAESANADVLLNNGLAAFSPSLAADQQHAYTSVALGDLDGDGDLDLAATDGSATTALLRFNLALPLITGFTPGSGGVGSSVTISGVNFTGATAVSFNGIAVGTAGFVVSAAGTSITVAVPPAATNGPIRVTTPAGTAVSATSFTVGTAVQLISRSPARNQLAVPRNSNVTLGFSQAVAAGSETTIRLRGRRRPRTGTFSGGGTASISFDPAQDFVPGEVVSVTVPTVVQGSSGVGTARHGYQFTAAAGAGPGTFGGGSYVPLSTQPARVLAADFDNDGDLDFIATARGTDKVSVALNNGSGSFTPLPYVTVPANPYGLAVGDVDNDGDLDAVLCCATANSSGYVGAVLRNNGTGSFVLAGTFALGLRPIDLALGDLDNDGDLDLASANSLASTVSLRFNDGSGTFRPGTELPMGAADAVALADTDSDGDLDLLALGTASNGNLFLRRNDGYGSFGALALSAIPGYATSLVVGDVDADGDLDVVTTHAAHAGLPYMSRNTAAVLLNTGSGSFAPAGEVAVGIFPQRATLGDVDGDGDLDLAVANSGTSLISVRLNNGHGSFGGGSEVNAGAAPEDVDLADLDGDGDLDMLAALPDASLAAVRFNTALPALSGLSPAAGPVGSVVQLTGSNLGGATRVTFNGVAATSFTAGATLLTATVPAGAATGLVQVTTPGGMATTPQLFTVTGPGPMLLASTPARNQLAAPAASNLSLSFSQAITAASAANLRVLGNQRRGRRPGTLSGGGSATLSFDPSQDFAPGEEVSVTLPATLQGSAPAAAQVLQFTAAAGVGPGTFGPGPDVPVDYDPKSVRAADVDNDGDADLLVSTLLPNTNEYGLSLRLNDGLGNFSNGPYIATQFNPLIPLAGDVDGDGDLDVVTAHYWNSDPAVVNVRLNNGTGTFGGGQNLSLGAVIKSAALGDLDADGDLDLLVSTYSGGEGRLVVCRNNGAGSFAILSPALALGLGSGAGPLALGDVDGDGDLDVATVMRQNSVVLALNNGQATFALLREVPVGDSPSAVLLRDLDGDRDLDLLTSNVTSFTISTRFNDGAGRFGGGQDIPGSYDYNYNEPSLGDVDGDGDLDMVQARQSTNQGQVSLYLNDGRGTFGLRQVVGVVGSARSPVLADFNSDGALDLASVGNGVNQGTATSVVSIRFNQVLPLQDLVIATPITVAGGAYNNVTVTSSGVGTLTGPLDVAGALVVQSGGVLHTNCQPLTGAGSFVLEAGAELGICDPAGISLSGPTGAIQLTGTRSFSPDASYTYNGRQAQVTGSGLPAQVRNLTVANDSSGLTLSQGVAVAQVLRLSDGDLSVGSQGLTLRSSAQGTALVDNSGGVVRGLATVQRWLAPGSNPGAGYRHLASPIANASIATLSTPGFRPTLNPAYNTAATPGAVTPFPTVYGYDESRLAASPATGMSFFDRGWVSPTQLANPLTVAQGYTVHLAANQTLAFTGPLNNGPISQTLGRSATPAAETGWHLVGNPYPSPLDWSRLTIPAGLDDALYVYQSTGAYAGTFRSYVNGLGSSPELALGQGFFVRANSPGTAATLTFSNAARITTFGPGQNFSRSTADTRPVVQLALRGPAGLADDVAYVYFEAGATTGPDGHYDAEKLRNPGASLQLAALAPAGGTEQAICGLPPLLGQACTVPLLVAVPQPGSYVLAASQVANFAVGTTVYLHDAQQGTRQALTAGTSYSFTLAGTTAPGRFRLEFAPAQLTATAAEAQAARLSVYPNPAPGRFTVQLPAGESPSAALTLTLTLVNSLGQVVRTLTGRTAATGFRAEVDATGLAAGVYSLRVAVAGQPPLVKRVVLQ